MTRAWLCLAAIGCGNSATPSSGSAPESRQIEPAAPTLAAELADRGPVLEFAVTADDSTAVHRLAGGVARPVSEPGHGRGLFPAAGPVPLAIAVELAEESHSEQLALVAGDGSVRLLGPVAGKIRNPSVAADGSWAVVESDAAGFRDLYRIDLATGESSRLTHDGDGAFEPAVSPDSRRIAFVSTAGGDPELHAIDADGGARRRLTHSPAHDTAPAWAPDSAQLAFVSDRDGPERIFVMAADGSGIRRLTGLAGDDRHEVGPVWSPDGQRIAYMVHHATGASELWVAEVAGGDGRRISPADARVGDPAWSPDGRLLAYSDGDGGAFDVWVARADGSERLQITSSPADEWLPRWRAAQTRARW